MKKYLALIICLLIFSCNNSNHNTNKSYTKTLESGIEVQVNYSRNNSDKSEKVIAHYKRSEIGDWKTTMELQNGFINFATREGVTSVITIDGDTSSTNRYYYIERIQEFSNKTEGKEQIKEIPLKNLKNLENIKTAKDTIAFIVSNIDSLDYSLLEKEYQSLLNGN